MARTLRCPPGARRLALAGTLLAAAAPAALALAPQVGLPLTPLTGEIQVSTQGNHHEYAAVAREPGGDFVVAWELPSPDAEVWARRFDADGTPKGEMFQVANDVDYVGGTKVAVSASGAFAVVWEQGNTTAGDAYRVYARVYGADGVAKGPAFVVGAGLSENQLAPDVAMDASGNFVVVWQGYGGTDTDATGIYAKRYDANGTETTPGAISRINSEADGAQANPDIAMTAAGDAVVVWGDDPISTDAALFGYIRARRLVTDSSNPTGPTITVDPYVQVVNGGGTDVDMAEDGSFVVGYRELVDGTFDAMYAHVGADDAVMAQKVRANAKTARDQEYVHVAVSDAGDRWAVGWTSERTADDGSGRSAHVRLFSVGGLSTDTVANETTLADQTLTGLAMDAGRGVVATWIGHTDGATDLQDTDRPFVRLFGSTGTGGVPPSTALDPGSVATIGARTTRPIRVHASRSGLVTLRLGRGGTARLLAGATVVASATAPGAGRTVRLRVGGASLARLRAGGALRLTLSVTGGGRAPLRRPLVVRPA